MAIAVASLEASRSATVQSSYTTGSISPTSGRGWLIWVLGAVNATDTAPTVPTVSGAGLTWTLKDSSTAFSTAGGFRRRRFYLFEGTGTPSSGALTIDFSGQSQFTCFWDIWEITGADTSAMLVQTVDNALAGGGATSGSITLASAGAADNRPVSGFSHTANEVTTFRTNWTEVSDQNASNTGFETQWRSDTFETTASASWTTSTQWGGVAAEIKAAGGGAFEINAAPGSYAVTGSSATLARGLFLNAAFGTYSVTGSDATLARGLFTNAEPGSYAVTGTAATFLYGRSLSVDPGAYTVTGTATTLAAGRVFNAELGSYTVTGLAATFALARNLSADPGAYVVSGVDAAIALAGVFALQADPGAYTVNGSTATLARGLFIQTDAGVYAVTGADATFLRGLVVSADPGAYIVAGVAAGLVKVGLVHLELTGYPPILVNPAGGYIQAIDRVEVEV